MEQIRNYINPDSNTWLQNPPTFKDAELAFKELGIGIRDADKNIKSFVSILNELQDKWQNIYEDNE